MNLDAISFITASHLLSFDDFKTIQSHFTPLFGVKHHLVVEPVTFVRSQARLSVIPEQQVALNNNYFPYLDCFKSLFHVSWGAKEKHLYLSCLNRALRVSPSISCFGLRSISTDECVGRGPEFRPLFCWTSHLLCPVLRQWLGPTFIGAYIAIWLSFIGAQVRCIPWKKANEVSTIQTMVGYRILVAKKQDSNRLQ